MTDRYFPNADGDAAAWEIAVMNEDGTAITRLTNNATSDEAPAWSADGSRIAYACGGICVMNADGTANVQVTNSSDADPAWKPDGSRILFTRDGQELYAINPDGSALTRVTTPQGAANATWSPDGSKIAFDCGNLLVMREICVANADGTGTVAITNSASGSAAPAWSPDGSRIAFVTDGGGGNDPVVALMNPDGTGVTILASGLAPTWSPDSRTVAFTSTTLITNGVEKVGADGTGLMFLTRGSGPAWQR